MRTRRGHRDNVADAATKDFVALRVLTALVEHGEFLTSRGAARAAALRPRVQELEEGRGPRDGLGAPRVPVVAGPHDRAGRPAGA